MMLMLMLMLTAMLETYHGAQGEARKGGREGAVCGASGEDAQEACGEVEEAGKEE